MKKFVVASGVFVVMVFVFSACSKSPVGPAVSSMSISASTTSSLSSTICVTSNGGGATSVSTQQANTVSTQTGDTGVANAYVSTGVNSSVNNGSTSNGNSTGSSVNGAINMSLVPIGTYVAWGSVTVSPGESPRFSWTVSGVTGINSYQIWVYSNTSLNYAANTAWLVSYSNPSVTSVVYGTAPAGAIVTTGPISLSKGSYDVIIHALDAENITIGGAYGQISVN